MRAQAGPTTPRDVARAFGLRGQQRAELRQLLRSLEAEGVIARDRGRKLRPMDGLPAVGVVEVTGLDEDGEPLARPTTWTGADAPPLIVLRGRRRGPAAGVGERLLVRLRRCADGTYEGQPIRRLPPDHEAIIGVLRRRADGVWLDPVRRGARSDLAVLAGVNNGVADGDLVRAELVSGHHRGRRGVRVVERLCDAQGPGAISRIAIHEAGIPDTFPPETLNHAAALRPATGRGRVDLRGTPLVTIDGADARDFDDAVFAERDGTGWHLIVAIADVASYVRPDDPVDREARRRGNSAYFPDLVVPMLPEVLSNDLCSLRPDEARPCLACHLWIDGGGDLRSHRFERAVMRSAARLTYAQVQAANDGRPDAQTEPLYEAVLAPLYGAHAALAQARTKRGVLELDLPERGVTFGADGAVAAIGARPRYASHRLIEDFMIAANVAAAETLEAKGWPCMYRVHEPPDPIRVDELREALASAGVTLSRGAPRAQQFNGALAKVAGQPQAQLVSQLILRAQAQAVYSPDNQGHFGLGLRRYAHFTSPIRRYADLLVHRALIAALGLGKDGLGKDGLGQDAAADFAALGAAISSTERRAAMAERSALDRYAASFLTDRVGDVFTGFISGVSRYGLFVTLSDVGADGLVPLSRLLRDDYEHDAGRGVLVGRHHGNTFRMGDAVEVRLVEARAISGSVVLDLLGVAGGAGEAGGGSANRSRKVRGVKRGKSGRGKSGDGKSGGGKSGGDGPRRGKAGRGRVEPGR